MGKEVERIQHNADGTFRKHCLNCIFVDYFDGDEYGQGSGLYCSKRDYKSSAEEDSHLGKLENEAYTFSPKKCCKLNKAI